MTERSSLLATQLDGTVNGRLDELLDAPLSSLAVDPPNVLNGAKVGAIVGFAEGGAVPLVTYKGQPTSAALRARSTVDLHAAHVGRQAVLMFEDGDPCRPIVIGSLQEAASAPLPGADVSVDADGQRLVISAREQIILRCGAASITLTKAGKVIVQGAYVSNRSSGVLRLKGGAVHIN